MLPLLLLLGAAAGGVALLTAKKKPEGYKGYTAVGGLTVGQQVPQNVDPDWEGPPTEPIKSIEGTTNWDNPPPPRAGGDLPSVTHDGSFDWLTQNSAGGIPVERVFEAVELADGKRYRFAVTLDYRLGLTDPPNADEGLTSWCRSGRYVRSWIVQRQGAGLPNVELVSEPVHAVESLKEPGSAGGQLCHAYFISGGGGLHANWIGRLISLKLKKQPGGFDLVARLMAPNPSGPPWHDDWYNGALVVEGFWSLEVTTLPTYND